MVEFAFPESLQNLLSWFGVEAVRMVGSNNHHIESLCSQPSTGGSVTIDVSFLKYGVGGKLENNEYVYTSNCAIQPKTLTQTHCCFYEDASKTSPHPVGCSVS